MLFIDSKYYHTNDSCSCAHGIMIAPLTLVRTTLSKCCYYQYAIYFLLLKQEVSVGNLLGELD